VAKLYTELIGLEVVWVDEETFLAHNPKISKETDIIWYWMYEYDRKFDRTVDNSRILAVTGLKKEDFADLREGLLTELHRAGYAVRNG